jgi:hypothetical protein
MKVCPQSTDSATGNNNAPCVLIPVEAEGFRAFSDAFALDGQWVIFLSIAGHKDAVKAIRATLLTNHWVTVGIHDICLLPRTKYGTSVKALPLGIFHTAVFIKNDLDQSQTYYALTARPDPKDSDLYLTALIKYSAVPVHSGWKTWLHKRAVQKKEIETLITHGVHGIKISLDDTSLAEDISTALEKGRLNKVFDNVSLLPFFKTSSRT